LKFFSKSSKFLPFLLLIKESFHYLQQENQPVLL